MRRLEAQLPILDPLGFARDAESAAYVANRVGPLGALRSIDPSAPFLPLRSVTLQLYPGRVVDSFGRFRTWSPGDGLPGAPPVLAAAALRVDGIDAPVLRPRSAQPARIDFRWLSALDDAVQSNAHPLTSPLCGWLTPNDFDRSVLVHDADGVLLGMVEQDGLWRPSPGDAAAPPGPALIANPHLARVVRWITSRAETETGFVDALLDTLDSSLRRIQPEDHLTQGVRALTVGRPVAVVRAMVKLRLEGLPATDESMPALALRIAGADQAGHGFGHVRIPIRIGEHGQLNDGLVGYFVDGGDADGARAGDVLFAPQADGTPAPHPSIEVYDTVRGTPLALSCAFDDPAVGLTLLMDPRCPVHATTGLLPTKAITIPRAQFMPSMRGLQMVFSGMPLLTPPGVVQAPLSRAPGARWSWVEMEDGTWRETPQDAFLTRAALRQALPGAADMLTPDHDRKADLLWERLVASGWIVPGEDGRAALVPSPDGRLRDLGPGLDAAEVAALLVRIARRIEPARRDAVFGPRPIVREGWFRLTPTAPRGR